VKVRRALGGLLISVPSKRQRVFVKDSAGEVQELEGSGYVSVIPGPASVWTYDRSTGGPTVARSVTVKRGSLPKLVVVAKAHGRNVKFTLQSRAPRYIPVYLVLGRNGEMVEIAYLENGSLFLHQNMLPKRITACWESEMQSAKCQPVRIKR
jgi:hypothetical protein